MTCITCNEWFEVYLREGIELRHRPVCGWEFSEDDLKDMAEEGDE